MLQPACVAISGPDMLDYDHRMQIKRTEVYDFIKNAKTRMPEEDETVKANHRKAVEEITRAIIKSPEGCAAGPKKPENPTKKSA